MNSPTTPRVAPSMAPQRLILPAQSPSKHFPMNATAFSMSEAEAIERAQQGDGVAFETLYGLHKRRVYSLCLRMVGNETGAEDLTQEAFLQVYRKIGTFRQQSEFSTWLHRVAVNVVLMHFRKKRLLTVSLEEPFDQEERDGPKKYFGTQDNLLAGSIDRITLERAIKELPSGYRNVFVLLDIEGYKHNEAAVLMGCTIGNTKSQLHKARLKLRLILKADRTDKTTEKAVEVDRKVS
jgi:RNA polymerase sigma-70 factor (ECF subfamily)